MKRIRIISFALAAVVLFFLVKQEFQITKSWRAWNLPLSGKVIVLDRWAWWTRWRGCWWKGYYRKGYYA